MNKFSTALAGCGLALALAVDAQQPAEQHSEHVQASNATPHGHGMAAMHEHMGAMREQMARIRATQDPEERQRLVREHMESMQQYMQMMGRMAPSSTGMRCAQGDMVCRTEELQSQQESMLQSMGEMRALMEQMMEHLRAATEE